MAAKPRTAISPTRQEDYAQWYQEVIAAADLAQSSDVRGCMVIKPWGYAIWENMQQALDGMCTGAEELADEEEAVFQGLDQVGADFGAAHAGGVGGADEGADRGAGDIGGLEAEFIEDFEDGDMADAAGAAAAEREADAPGGVDPDRSRHGLGAGPDGDRFRAGAFRRRVLV